MVTGKHKQRTLIALAIGITAAVLTACSAGTPLPSGEAWLTIYNPNSTADGTFYYTNIFVDSKAISTNMISAGQSFQVAVTYNKQHQIEFDFVQQPNPPGVSKTEKVGPVFFTVPSSGYTYQGPKYTPPIA